MSDGRKYVSICLFRTPGRINSSLLAVPLFATITNKIILVNEARAIRVAEIMTDFRNLQHYLAQLRLTPTAEEYYLEGYSLLRECINDAQSVLQQPFSGSVGSEPADPVQETLQLKAYVVVQHDPRVAWANMGPQYH